MQQIAVEGGPPTTKKFANLAAPRSRACYPWTDPGAS